MMTSRAEYRLLLRQDNADIRLREKGYQVGLISEKEYKLLQIKKHLIEKETDRLKNTFVGANKEIQSFLEKKGSTPLKTGTSLAELICRPELSYDTIAEIDKDRESCIKQFMTEVSEIYGEFDSSILTSVMEQVEIEVKYEGYILRQKSQVEKFKKMEKKQIPDDIDYDDVASLRIEARQKLKQFRPISLGQASRISGVSPADISVLLVYLEQLRRKDS